MRFQRLQVPAFGPFTNLDLRFPDHPCDLHVIYGANEAGKSSLLRVIRDLLFGIHSQSHPKAWFGSLGPGRMAAEIEEAQAGLRAVTGVTPRWFHAVVRMANPVVSASMKKLPIVITCSPG